MINYGEKRFYANDSELHIIDLLYTFSPIQENYLNLNYEINNVVSITQYKKNQGYYDTIDLTENYNTLIPPEILTNEQIRKSFLKHADEVWIDIENNLNGMVLISYPDLEGWEPNSDKQEILQENSTFIS
jgi:hypothetical protein